MVVSKSAEINGLENKKTKMILDVQGLKKKLTFLREKSVDLQRLQDKGWETPYGRVRASQSLEVTAEDARLNSLYYEFAPEKERVGTRHTRVNIELTAVIDGDVMNYMDKITEDFPGIVQPVALSLSRYEHVSPQALESLKTGDEPDFVYGKISFDWVALSDKS